MRPFGGAFTGDPIPRRNAVSELETIAVKRKGGRGWHLINKSAFDPAVHVVHDPAAESAEAARIEAEELAKKAKK